MGKDNTARRGAGRWRQWREAEARAALAEFDASGESAAAFAQRKGCSATRIWYWKKRLAASAVPEFVAVPLPTSASVRWIEIDNGRVVVRVREGFDVEQVARLVGSIVRQVGGAC